MANTEENKTVKFYRGQFGVGFDKFGTTEHPSAAYDPSGIYFNFDTKTIFQSGVEYGVKPADFDTLKTKVDNSALSSAKMVFNGTSLILTITSADGSKEVGASVGVDSVSVKFTPIVASATQTAITGGTVQAAFESVATSLKTNENAIKANETAIAENTTAIATEKTRAQAAEKVNADAITAIKGTGYDTADYKDIASLSDKVKTLEGIEYTGENAIKVTDTKIGLTLATGEKILSQSANGLLSTLSLGYANQKIQLLGVDEAVVAELSAAEFVKDGFLESVELDSDNNLVFTWNTSAGKHPLKVNIGKYIDTYTAGNGLALTDKSFSVKLDTANEGFLTVGTGGVKLSGVQDAIDAAMNKEAARAQAAEKVNADAIAVLNGADTVAGSVAKTVKDAITGLDSTATSTGENNNVKVTVKLVDGKLPADGVTVVDGTQAKFDAIDKQFESLAWIDCGTYAGS